MTNLSTTWLQANFASLYKSTLNFLQIKVKHNFRGVDLADILHDYYLVAASSDRLACRLTTTDSGDVIEIKGKEITASRLALFAFNTMLDGLDKSIRHNVDVAQQWSVTNDEDREMVKFYATPPSALSEAFEGCIGVLRNEINTVVVATPCDIEERADEIDPVEHEALFELMGSMTAFFKKRGKPIPYAKEAVVAELFGHTSTELAEELGINRGNAREKMVVARLAIDHWASIHRDCLRILKILIGGGRVPNADPQLMLLMQKKQMIDRNGDITNVGRTFADLPTTPRVFRESIPYHLLS